MTDFQKFPSIEGFHNVIKWYRPGLLDFSDNVMYCAKIKLHGTNASIRFDFDGADSNGLRIRAGKRTGFITPQDDNAGFACWVEENLDWLSDFPLLGDYSTGPFTIYGEWVGPGIQNGTALNQLPHKVFCPFMVTFKDGVSWMYNGMKEFIREKDDIIILKPIKFKGEAEASNCENYVFDNLPNYEHVVHNLIMVDYMDRNKQVEFAAYLNAIVQQIDVECPWAKQRFGVSGPGEGLVLYPYRRVKKNKTPEANDSSYMFNVESFSRWAFKAKGEKHQVVKNKAPVVIAPEVVKERSEFVEKFVTENRLQQGYDFVKSENAGIATMQNMGAFLKWMGNDIIKESVAEVEASGKDWKHFSGDVTKACATWYKLKMLEI